MIKEKHMEWIPVSIKPKKLGFYICLVPKCKRFNKHWDKYYWDGEKFIDKTPHVGRDKIVEASHYLLIIDIDNKTVMDYI